VDSHSVWLCVEGNARAGGQSQWTQEVQVCCRLMIENELVSDQSRQV